MSSDKRRVIEIFQSMMQPLTQAKQTKPAKNRLSAKDFEFDMRRIKNPNARFPGKSAQHTQALLIKKQEELTKLEDNTVEIVAKIWAIFSQAGFQALFKPMEKVLLQNACDFLQLYSHTHMRLMQNAGKAKTPVDNIKSLYGIEYFKLQEQLIRFFPELFALSQIFRMPQMNEKIERYFQLESQIRGKKESVAETIFDPKEFILSGKNWDIVIMAVQKVNRHALVLREIIERMEEGYEVQPKPKPKLKNIYAGAEKANLFVHEMMRKTGHLSANINYDPFCLKELLFEDATYSVILDITKEEKKDIRDALRFLRELSILARKNYFTMDALESNRAVIMFAFKHIGADELNAYVKSGKHVALMEALRVKVLSNLELIEPVLRQFVSSEYFIKKANLRPLARETEESCQARLENRVSHGSECIALFLIEKEEKKQLEQRRLNPNPSATSIRDKKNKASSALKALAWIAPFLILTAIPFVGIFIPLIGFIVLGSARLLYCLVECMEEDKIKYGENEGLIRNKRIAANDSVKTEQENSRKNQNISINKRRAAEKLPGDNADEAKKDVLTMPSYLADRKRPGSAIRRHSGLGAGRWLEEDRERREKGAENDAFGMQDLVSGSESEITSLSWFSEDSESEMSYESFSEVELNSDEDEEEAFISPIQSRKFGVGK